MATKNSILWAVVSDLFCNFGRHTLFNFRKIEFIVMKRNLFIFLIALIASFSVSVFAADNGPAISFKETKVDFGNIHAKEGKVTAVYQFTNTGSEPLIIVTVTNGGCGCTTPSYPKAPIAPGKTGEIKITFDPTGRRGDLNRELKLRTNPSKKRVALRFSGNILPD